MRSNAKACFVAFVFALVGALAAAPVPEQVRSEINALLVALQASGCEFNRNGSWYSGTEARAHLQRKFEYLEGKGAVASTEQFIELGASTSSTSGKAYLVRCGATPAVESKNWLYSRLSALRAKR